MGTGFWTDAGKWWDPGCTECSEDGTRWCKSDSERCQSWKDRKREGRRLDLSILSSGMWGGKWRAEKESVESLWRTSDRTGQEGVDVIVTVWEGV